MADWINVHHEETGGTAEVTPEAQELVFSNLGWKEVSAEQAVDLAEEQAKKMPQPEGHMTREEALAKVEQERAAKSSPPAKKTASKSST